MFKRMNHIKPTLEAHAIYLVIVNILIAILMTRDIIHSQLGNSSYFIIAFSIWFSLASFWYCGSTYKYGRINVNIKNMSKVRRIIRNQIFNNEYVTDDQYSYFVYILKKLPRSRLSYSIWVTHDSIISVGIYIDKLHGFMVHLNNKCQVEIIYNKGSIGYQSMDQFDQHLDRVIQIDQTIGDKFFIM